MKPTEGSRLEEVALLRVPNLGNLDLSQKLAGAIQLANCVFDTTVVVDRGSSPLLLALVSSSPWLRFYSLWGYLRHQAES